MYLLYVIHFFLKRQSETNLYLGTLNKGCHYLDSVTLNMCSQRRNPGIDLGEHQF